MFVANVSTFIQSMKKADWKGSGVSEGPTSTEFYVNVHILHQYYYQLPVTRWEILVSFKNVWVVLLGNCMKTHS